MTDASESRILPEEVADGAVPDADLGSPEPHEDGDAAEPQPDSSELGGTDTIEANDDLDGDVQR